MGGVIKSSWMGGAVQLSGWSTDHVTFTELLLMCKL